MLELVIMPNFCHRILPVLLLLCSCRMDIALPNLPTAVYPISPITPPPTPPVTPLATTPLPTLAPTASPELFTLSAQTAVPPELQTTAQTIAANSPLFRWVDDPTAADVVIAINEGTPLSRWLYVVAAPFATVADDIELEVVESGWASGTTPLGSLYPAASGLGWTAVFGMPFHLSLPETDFSPVLWQNRPALTLLPFHQLVPDLKLLTINGRSPLDPNFDPASYPLQLTFGAMGRETAVSQLQALWPLPASNYDPQKMTRVALSGVTALVRATAYQMELNGILYPAQDVAPVFQAADFAHVSNEVAFAPNCPSPNPVGGTSFCSSEAYFALLQALGIDVIELTGNHLNDWGQENLLYTLDLYDRTGLQTFGGGRDLTDAAQPLRLDHHGNKIALTGCNPYGPVYAWATDSTPGARPCDEAFLQQISQLWDEGYLVLATQQYAEYYHYPPTPQQQTDFRRLIEAGATAVSGSQGHHAQTFEFYNGGFIHYGLGNLFFDQMDMLGTRQTFIDTYVFYNGRLLTITLWTGLIENWAYPRQATPAEREQALQTLFQVAGW